MDNKRFHMQMDNLLREAEEMRLSAMKTQRNRGFISMGFGLAAIILGAGGFGWLFFVDAELLRALAAITLGALVAFALNMWSMAGFTSYEHAYKTRFLPKMAQLLGGFKYYQSRGISHKLLGSTGIIPPHDVYDAEDCFMGHYKGIKVLFSEARLRHKKKYLEPIFNGLFVFLELPQPRFEGHTIITADNGMVRQWRSTRWKKLSDVYFNMARVEWERFRIFSDRPEAAQEAVSNRLLKELSETSAIFNDSMLTAVLFKKKYVFLMIPYDGDMFEASNIHVPVTTKRHAMRCKKEIEQILEIIDVFEIYGSDAEESQKAGAASAPSPAHEAVNPVDKPPQERDADEDQTPSSPQPQEASPHDKAAKGQ